MFKYQLRTSINVNIIIISVDKYRLLLYTHSNSISYMASHPISSDIGWLDEEAI